MQDIDRSNGLLQEMHFNFEAAVSLAAFAAAAGGVETETSLRITALFRER